MCNDYNFRYLKDDTDLINHLNSSNVWNKSPNVIIITEFEKYIKEFNTSVISFIWSILLNAARVLSEKHNNNTKVIVAYNCLENLEIISQIYFKHYFPLTDGTDTQEDVDKVINVFR